MANTVKVRIAVAVNASGEYDSCGYNGASDARCAEHAIARLCTPGVITFIEAEIPIPEIQTIQAKVSDA